MGWIVRTKPLASSHAYHLIGNLARVLGAGEGGRSLASEPDRNQECCDCDWT